MITSIKKLFFGQKTVQTEVSSHLIKIRKQAEIGGEIFGKIPNNVRREFFCLDEHTWIWHEEKIAQNGGVTRSTTRYDITPSGIFKSGGKNTLVPISDEEAHRLKKAIELYNTKLQNFTRAELSTAG